MAQLTILHYPDSRLHQKADVVNDFNIKLKQLVTDMAQTMYANNGIGLAATQVNVQKRVFVMDLRKDGESDNLQVFINPEIVFKSGEVFGEEGCLSVPGVFESIVRAEFIELKYQDIYGKIHLIKCDGLMSVCVQHEIDHLDGKVFVEYLSELKQKFIKKKFLNSNKLELEKQRAL